MRRVELAFVAAAVAAVAGFGATAQAQASQSQCPDGYVCAWEDPNFSGGFFAHKPLYSIGDFGAHRVDGRFFEALTYDNGHPLDDSISSTWNRTSLTATFWPTPWYRYDPADGCAIIEEPGGVQPNLALGGGPSGGVPGCANDVFSALRVTIY